MEKQQLQEISKKTLGNYLSQAARNVLDQTWISAKAHTQSMVDPGSKERERERHAYTTSLHKSFRRLAGISRAARKLTKEENLQELSKRTLASYVKYASGDVSDLGAYASSLKGSLSTARKGSRKDVEASLGEVGHTMQKRQKNIARATQRLASESNLMRKGMSKAARAADTEQSDREYILQQQRKRKQTPYADKFTPLLNRILQKEELKETKSATIARSTVLNKLRNMAAMRGTHIPTPAERAKAVAGVQHQKVMKKVKEEVVLENNIGRKGWYVHHKEGGGVYGPYKTDVDALDAAEANGIERKHARVIHGSKFIDKKTGLTQRIKEEQDFQSGSYRKTPRGVFLAKNKRGDLTKFTDEKKAANYASKYASLQKEDLNEMKTMSKFKRWVYGTKHETQPENVINYVKGMKKGELVRIHHSYIGSKEIPRGSPAYFQKRALDREIKKRNIRPAEYRHHLKAGEGAPWDPNIKEGTVVTADFKLVRGFNPQTGEIVWKKVRTHRKEMNEAKLERKPWNDPWTRAAMRDPNYKAHQTGSDAAKRMSWRRINKAFKKFETSRYFAVPKLGRQERKVVSAAEKYRDSDMYEETKLNETAYHVIKHLEDMGMQKVTSERQGGAHAFWMKNPKEHQMKDIHQHMLTLPDSGEVWTRDVNGRHTVHGVTKKGSFVIIPHGKQEIHVRLHKGGTKGKMDRAGMDVSESTDLVEVLTKRDPASKWIHDFVHSDNPKFAGKSKEKRRQMALGAYYAKMREDIAHALIGKKRELNEISKGTLRRYISTATDDAVAATKQAAIAKSTAMVNWHLPIKKEKSLYDYIKADRRRSKRISGIVQATKKLANEENLNEYIVKKVVAVHPDPEKSENVGIHITDVIDHHDFEKKWVKESNHLQGEFGYDLPFHGREHSGFMPKKHIKMKYNDYVNLVKSNVTEETLDEVALKPGEYRKTKDNKWLSRSKGLRMQKFENKQDAVAHAKSRAKYGKESGVKWLAKLTAPKKMTQQEREEAAKRNSAAIQSTKLTKEETLDEGRGRPRKHPLPPEEDMGPEPDQHIIVQLKKASEVEKPHVITFADGKKHPIAATVAKQLLAAHDRLQKPAHKETMQKMMHASYDSLHAVHRAIANANV